MCIRKQRVPGLSSGGRGLWTRLSMWVDKCTFCGVDFTPFFVAYISGSHQQICRRSILFNDHNKNFGSSLTPKATPFVIKVASLG